MTSRSPISNAEMERRWAAMRKVMAEHELDALIMQNASDWVGGYVRWFTDIPATHGYPRTVVFYADKPMTVIEMGEFGAMRELGGSDPLPRGVGRVVNSPSFVSIAYSNAYDAELLVAELQRTQPRRVGWITPGALPHALIAAVETMSGAPELVDASDAVDAVKAVKSAEEIALIRKTADLQDKVFAEVCDFIRPGLRDIDIANHAQAAALRLDSDQGIYLGASAPMGSPSRLLERHMQSRPIAQGDHFTLLIEVNGPGGMYVEIARTMVLGSPSNHLAQSFETMLEAQRYSLSLIRPGASPADIANAHDAWMVERGLPAERRLYAHGQGTDMVERPLIRKDETLPLAANMCLAVHPGFDDGEVFAVICDNYLVTETGVSDCLHQTDKKLFQL